MPFTTGQCCKFKDRSVSKIYCGVVTPYVPLVAPDTPTFCNDLATIQQSWVWAYNRQRLEDSVRRYIVPQIEAVCQSVTDSLWWRIKQPEFAFTLYYYDRAGNRVAVVPPDGVEMLSDDSTGMVPGARANGNVLRPNHRKVVLWRYTASNQVWMRHHPDRGTDLTWYDPADRPIATQDARQRAENKVSFIKYDSLSRPIEGGVASLYSNFTNFAYENNVPINTSVVWDRFVQVYDTAASGSPIPSGHFRGRVATHKVWQKWTGSEEPDYIVYYDYDLMGRVKREIHKIPMLKRFKHQFFEMSYLYDAVSGKVKEMRYNAGKKDQFFHKFAYDAMGNLKYVWTSRDGKHWTLESALKYYPDGKLMRREIRPKDLMLQGLDYAYTLDGWLKAINSEVLENDPSQDGISGTYQYFARDVFSLLLRYYPNDYKPIKPTATPLEVSIISGSQHLYKPYYTGWISSWSLHLDTLHTAYSFRYDRLGRLTRATTLTGFKGTEWNASLIKNYSTKYSYDLVGNILSLTRYGPDTNAIDVLTYEYYNRSRNNRLKRIIDGAGRMIGIDLETQPLNNYSYDPVGNMIYDKSRSLKVSYTYSNKPKRIQMGNHTIKMFYNPSGYRFFKGKGSNKGQIFVYNSQGQLMAKYTIDGKKLKLDFMSIYEGTKRLGILEPSGVLWIDCPSPRLCFEEDSLGFVQLLIPSEGSSGGEMRAERKYELTDHLGNVRVVIRDQRVPISTNGATVAYYKPLVDEISDYYPYGWQKILGRYQFGANAGSLFEDWDSSRGTYYTLYRLLDARIARWYQVEPLWENYAWMSPYVVNGDNPIVAVDPLGDAYEVEVDHSKKVITVKATYLVQKGDRRLYKAIKKGVRFWRRQRFKYVLPSGEEYKVRFKLDVKRIDKNKTKFKSHSNFVFSVALLSTYFNKRGKFGELFGIKVKSVPNYVVKVSKEEAPKDDIGGFVDSRNLSLIGLIDLSGRVAAHEIGHTLGLGHYKESSNLMNKQIRDEEKHDIKNVRIEPVQVMTILNRAFESRMSREYYIKLEGGENLPVRLLEKNEQRRPYSFFQGKINDL